MGDNIFTKKDNKNSSQLENKTDSQTQAILTLMQRQKDLESSVDLLSQKDELLSHTQNDTFKKVFQDMKSIKEENLKLRMQIQKLNEFNSKLKTQLKLFTIKDETLKLEKYIDLWNPMEFLTTNQMENIKKDITKDIEKIVGKFLTN